MNRTKEEIVKHALTTGYSKLAVAKISGFLIGIGMKDASEIINWKIGDKQWCDFYHWFYGCEKRKKSVFDTIAEDIFTRLDECKTPEERARYQAQLEWLCKHHIDVVDQRK